MGNKRAGSTKISESITENLLRASGPRSGEMLETPHVVSYEIKGGRMGRSAPVEAQVIEDASPYFRYQTVGAADFSDDNTFQIAASSEFPGEQVARKEHERLGIAKVGEGYVEILSHEDGDVDLSRFNGENRAAFLDEHKDNRHIGSIKKATLAKDKVVRAVISLDGATKLSKTRAKQLRSGSRTNVSTGYVQTRYLGTRKLDDGRMGHVFAWSALEISSVAVPMDPTVGLNRAQSDNCHCFGCGRSMERSKMTVRDEALYCGSDCADSEEPAEDAEVGNRRADGRIFRAKKDGAEIRISHNELRSKTLTALDGDKRFKHKRANGDMVSDFYLHDNHQIGADGSGFQAIVSSPAWRDGSKMYAVDFAFDGSAVALGEMTEVVPKTTLEAVERGFASDLRVFRSDMTAVAVRGDSGDEVSLENLRGLVQVAAKGDKRFNKKANGDEYEYVWVVDIICSEVAGKDDYKAVVQAANGKYYEVGFTFTDKAAVLGTAIEVAPHTEYKAVRCVRAGRAVDFKKLAEADRTAETNLPKKVMPKTVAELTAENPEAVTSLRTEVERTTRSAVLDEVNQKATQRGTKVTSARGEIVALANEYVKQSGRNWAGPAGAVVVVGEQVRLFAERAFEKIDGIKDDASFASEISAVRNAFKTDCGELIRSSRAPKNQEEAANLPDELAGRCSLRSLYNAAAAAQERGTRSGAWMPTEGAEFEADRELRKIAREFPGGMAHATEGICLPFNMRSARLKLSRGEMRRLTRDSLAGDFPTAGALIAPEYKFPTIELLRNKMALGRAGITILGGVIGNLVLPRQTAPTTSQSVAEGAALAQFDQVFDQIRMAPHRIGSSQKYSRLALLQTTEDFEALVMNDHMAQNALRADYLGLNGAGANDEPLGIMNQIGIGVVTFAGSAANAYKNIIAMETAIRAANIDEEPTYITTSTARGTLRITPATLTGSTVVSGESNALWVGDELVGRGAVDSQQVPGNVLIALVGRHLVMAQWGGWQVVLDTLTLADQDKIKLSMNTYIDYALRHPQAVARSADSLASLT